MNQAKRDTLLESLLKGQSDMHAEIAKISRGLYGEPTNDVPGLIDKQKEDEEKFKRVDKALNWLDERITENERFRTNTKKTGKTLLKIVGGGTTVGGSAIVIFFEQVKKFIATVLHL